MKYTPYVIIIALFFFIAWNNLDIKLKSPVKTTVDSIKVIKETKEVKGVFKTIAPKPTIINNYISNDKQLKQAIQEIEKKYKKQADSAVILREYIQAIKTRKYVERYEDSAIAAVVKAETIGKLKSIDFKYTLKPQKVVFHEKTITKKIAPKFSFLLGAKITSSSDLNNSFIELNTGLQDKRGNIYEIGYNTNNQISIGGKITVFRKY